MATTDKTEWILLDTDLTTRLAILPTGPSHLFYVINDAGSGELRIPLDSTAASLVTSGMFCECYYRGSSRGGFFIDNQKKTQASAGENGDRWLSVSGLGPLNLLDDAIVWDNGTTETTREFSGLSKASILVTLITEAQARGALANLSYDFTASQDTAAVTWTDSETYKLPVGTSLLDVARQFAKTGGFDFEMNLVAGSFVLSAYANGIGTNKSSTIYMRTGTNCEEVNTDERGDAINNALRVKYKAGYLTVSDSTSITNRRRREKLLSLEQAQTSASATTYASAQIAGTKDPKTSIALRVYDGVSPRLFEDYSMGDYVTTDVLGTEVSYRVLGIQADFDGYDFSRVVLELNNIQYDKQQLLSQELEWLQNQWVTANDANELETSFWFPIGTRSATGIKDMLIYGGYLYICGLGNMGASGYPGVARYQISTGTWSGMGTSFTSTDECTALVVMGGEIYVSAVRTSPRNIVYKWNGVSWDEYFYTAGAAGAKVIQMIPQESTSNILLCGSGFSDLAAPAYRFVSGTNLVGTDRYALTFWAGAGTCQTIAFYGTTLHAGWVSTSGYTGFMRTKALSPARDGCVLEFDPIVITELNNCYATKLLEFGSNLLVAYKDNATGTAYLGSWNGSAFSVLGTFTNGGGNATISAITTYLTDIYVAGDFTIVDGVTGINRVAKYSGGAWSQLTNGIGSGSVVATVFNDLDFFAAGTFDDVDGGTKPADGLGVYFTNFEKALDFASHNTSVQWGDIGGTLSNQTDLQAALDAKVSLASTNYVDLTDGGETTLHKHNSDSINMPKVGTPTLDTLTEDFTTSGSSGVSDGTLTYLSVGSTAVKISVAAGEGYIRTSNDQQAPLVFCKWSASADLYTFSAPAAGQETAVFFGISYNAGTPIAISSSTFSDFNGFDKFWLGRVSYDGTTIRILNSYAHAEDVANGTRLWMRRLFPFQREQAPEGTGGLELSVSLRALAMSTGAVWHGYNRYLLSTVASGSAFDTHYKRSGGGFNSTTGVTSYPNTQYDNGSGTLQDLGASKYGVLWVYVDISDGTLDIVYGAVNATSTANAQLDTVPTTPNHLTYHGRLIGRIIFQKSGASPAIIESAWATTFSPGGGGGSGDALTTNPLSQFAATTSAQLAGVLSDETGTGLAVFNDTPTILTPTIASLINMNHTHAATGATGGVIPYIPTDGWIVESNTWTFKNRTQAFTNDPAAGNDIALNMVDTTDFIIGSNITVTSSAGSENTTITAVVANTSITCNQLLLNHTTTSRLVTLLDAFTINADVTANIKPGTYVKFTQTTVKYGTVLSATNSGGTTTVVMINNTDYTLTNAAISATSYSNVSYPAGFPVWFNYDPEPRGWSTVPVTDTTYKFAPLARSLKVSIAQASDGGTSNATTTTFSSPVVPITFTGAVNTSAVDNGTTFTTATKTVVTSITAVLLSARSNMSTGTWTASGAKRIVCLIDIVF
jgi:hypothetical protein